MLVEKRLSRQYDCIVSAMKVQRTVVLKHLSSKRSEEVAFGRFFRNPRIEMSSILSEITQNVAPNVQGKSILLIEDSSELCFGFNSGIKAIGKVGSGDVDGFYTHPVLALDAHTKHCYGLAHCHIFNQNHGLKDMGLDKKARKRLSNQIPFEQKDSHRWVSSIQQAHQVCHLAESMTVIADREADIYQALHSFKHELMIDFLIRMRINRPVETDIEGQKIEDILQNTPVNTSYKIKLPATDKRSKHEAELEVKWAEVDIKRPQHKQYKKLSKSIKINVIEVTEKAETVVNNEEPIHWILLTSHKIETFEDAYQIIQWYTWRWFIEQLFRLLKSQGLDMQGSTLTTYQALGKLSLLALEAAVKVLQLLIARDADTPQPIQTAFSEQEIEALTVLSPTLEGNTEKLKNPHNPTELKFAIWVVARLAGWSGYQKQTPPGPITLHRGLLKFKQIFEGYKIAKSIYQRTG
jgi:Transposase DDE domain